MSSSSIRRPYPGLRPLAVCGARSRGTDVELVTSRFRSRRRSRGRLRRARVVLSTVVAHGRNASSPGGEGARAPVRNGPVCRDEARRHPQAWLGAPRWIGGCSIAQPCRSDTARRDPAAHALQDGDVAHLFGRIDRVVVHSERDRATRRLRHCGGETARDRASRPPFRDRAADDGRTALCLGLIRPYKGTEDAVEAVLGVDGARLLVVGDPRVPLDGLQRTAGDRADWRLGYLPDSELRRALSESTVALFPYRAEIDVSGALLQVLGAGFPRSSTTSAGSRGGRPVGAARSFHRGTSTRCRPLSSTCSETRRRLHRLAQAPKSARGAHLGRVRRGSVDLYRELV